ncbi:GntR family transcriptional regulator [Faecalicatena sp. AGMB00832]|uniref:GntR family transcriptional regulator n=1 Tax=Faecalicatena faecalis TaxID=2726362 RepID=A0ABS6D7N0_9FIRM|nr:MULTISPECIES: GntR family transcriptional regulator [Faecalicatena]MBU3877597.1 GntR family transcriptional regulator [Faecalicatena faecalis]MCI6463904.1 GntR family transcriptional regulator [Faecalicatena sp.]MDY5620804.1 GntR family transcriptional regulator [Lachnospiraceae bacterium]
MLQNKQLNKDTPIPLYFQLKKLILDELDSGELPVGSILPTENELMEMFSISRTTVRQAITELVQEGKLYRIKSKGTFVSKPKIDQNYIRRLQSFNVPSNEEIKDSGRIPSTEVLGLEAITTPAKVAKVYGNASCEQVIRLYRRRAADGEPIARVETYLPYDRCQFVLEHDFMKEGLHEVLSLHPDTKIYRISRTCEAVPAGIEDVEMLGVKRGSPIHLFTNIGYNKDDEIIEYSCSHCRGDQSKLHFEITLE